MKILVAPDKFKGSLSAHEAAQAIAAGLRSSGAEIVACPIADGGEGTCELIGEARDARRVSCMVSDAFGRPVEACFYIDEQAAYLDASQAAGLWRLAPNERDPTHASTIGLGEQMRAAVDLGARKLIIGLGGSATCDGGVGMAAALGLRFLTSDGEPIREIPANFLFCTRILPAERSFPKIIAACDVSNPLLGRNGAARVFAPQKGASPAEVEFLERALEHLAELVTQDLKTDFRNTPGAGAAGGLAFGLMSFCGAQICSGFHVVAEAIGLEAALRECTLVITGEGSLDAQTLSGKGPAGVAAMARKWGKPVVAFGGRIQPELETADLFDQVIGINSSSLSAEESMRRGAELLTAAAAELCASARFRAWS